MKFAPPTIWLRLILMALLTILIACLPFVASDLETRAAESSRHSYPEPPATQTSTSTTSSNLLIYGNGGAQGFSDASFGYSSRTPCDTHMFVLPPCSYAISYRPWGGINFHPRTGAIAPSLYSALAYDLNPNGQPLRDFSVLFLNSHGWVIKQHRLSSADVTARLPGGWVHISVPVSVLDPSNASISGIQLKNWTNRSLAPIHVDAVELVAATPNSCATSADPDACVSPQTDPAPSPTIILTTTPTSTSTSTSTPTATSTPTSTPTSTSTPTATSTPATNGLLPGQQIWKNGVSSFLFGTNDTGEWGYPNIEFTDTSTAPGTANTSAQNLVKQAGFTLDRIFVPHHDFATGKEMSDAEIQARLSTATNAGMQCLGVLVSINPNSSSKQSGDTYTDVQFAQHVVSLFGSRCNMYEIGNESGLSAQNYASVWNVFVPVLKQINPNAKFIGPVTDQYYNGYITQWLQQLKSTHGPLPDAISWHYYPCGGGLTSIQSAEQCAQQEVSVIGQEVASARNEVQGALGYQLPLGISEWSADNRPNGNSNLAMQEPGMSDLITAVLNAMIQAHLDFANEFDMQSGAAYDGLDMLDSHNQPRPYFNAYTNLIGLYKQ